MDYELLLIDVGHGNGTVIRAGCEGVVVDAGCGATIQEILEEKGVSNVAVIISHADSDHVAGATALLLDDSLDVRAIYVNPDATKGKVWEAFRRAIQLARVHGKNIKVFNITSDTTGLGVQEVAVEVLYPPPEIQLGGAGSTDVQGRNLESNSMSVVLKVVHGGREIALLPGDIDGVALQNIRERNIDLSAEVLVFPHHGGLPRGASPDTFAKELCDLVKPRFVFFSNGRGKHNNPNQTVLDAIRLTSPQAYVACSQLAKKCMPDLEPFRGQPHFCRTPAKGLPTRSCCAGTVSLSVERFDASLGTFQSEHSGFLKDVSTPRCK